MNENELKKPWLSSAEDDDVFSDILESRHLVVFPWLIEIILGLRPASVLVVVTHPCFREESYSSFKTQFNNEDYLQNGSSFGVEVFDRDKAIQFVDYHWNLSTMLKQSREVGFRMLALAKLPDAPGGNPRGAPWLCFEFDKA